jgi:hypothetical protein
MVSPKRILALLGIAVLGAGIIVGWYVVGGTIRERSNQKAEEAAKAVLEKHGLVLVTNPAMKSKPVTSVHVGAEKKK